MATAETRAFDAQAAELVPTAFPMTEDNREDVDDDVTAVMFRRYRSGHREVLAIFPYEQAGELYTLCYQHVGQHGSGDYQTMIAQTRPAAESDADVQELKRELEHRGYRLRVIKRASHERRMGR